MQGLRQAGIIAANQLFRFVLDWRGMLILFLIPLAFNLVLGVSLRQAFSPEFRPDLPYRVAVALPTGSAGEAVLEQALEEAEDDGWITVEAAPTAGAAVEAVQRRQAEAAVVVPPGFPDRPLEVIAEPGTVTAAVVESIMREAVAVLATTNPAGVRSIPVGLAIGPAPVTDGPATTTGGSDATPRNVNAMAYYAAAMAVMMIYFATREGTHGYLEDRVTGVYLRVRAGGTGPGAYLGGTLVGSVAVGLVFMAVMTLTTRWLFGVRWGHLGGWAVLTVASALAAAGVNSLLLAFVRSPEVKEMVTTALAQVLGFAGGSMMPLFLFPDILARVSQWVPNRWMLDGYLELMAGAGPTAVVSEATRLAGVGAALLIAGVILDRAVARKAGEA